MFAPTRDEARRFLADAWRKRREGVPMSELERVTAQVVGMHPEYHALLEQPERLAEHEYHPETGEMNPFLHLSLHLAVAEQLAIDQPPGLRGHFERIAQARGSEHDALHAIVECLGEVVWHSQRHGTPPDGALYLACLERQN